MSKHTAPIARRLVAASLFALVSTGPVLAEVRLDQHAALTPAVMQQPAPSPAVVRQGANAGSRVTDGVLSCTRSGRRMVC